MFREICYSIRLRIGWQGWEREDSSLPLALATRSSSAEFETTQARLVAGQECPDSLLEEDRQVSRKSE